VSEKRFQVRFTGCLKPGLSRQTVLSNLVLETGLPEERLDNLFARGESLVKRCETATEAQRIADKFTRAGATCLVVDTQATGDSTTGKSMFSSLLRAITPGGRKGDEASSSTSRAR